MTFLVYFYGETQVRFGKRVFSMLTVRFNSNSVIRTSSEVLKVVFLRINVLKENLASASAVGGGFKHRTLSKVQK